MPTPNIEGPFHVVNSVPSNDVNWTAAGKVTPVKDQGQCGSCWAFSTTGSMESAHAIKTGSLISLSEQQLVDCSSSFGNQGCNGGWYYYAWDYALTSAVELESAYPYTALDGTCNYSASKG
jgi:C1A family cysteine protease